MQLAAPRQVRTRAPQRARLSPAPLRKAGSSRWHFKSPLGARLRRVPAPSEGQSYQRAFFTKTTTEVTTLACSGPLPSVPLPSRRAAPSSAGLQQLHELRAQRPLPVSKTILRGLRPQALLAYEQGVVDLGELAGEAARGHQGAPSRRRRPPHRTDGRVRAGPRQAQCASRAATDLQRWPCSVTGSLPLHFNLFQMK